MIIIFIIIDEKMFDFTAIRNQITHDLAPMCVNNYLILNEIGVLPKELTKCIIYDLFSTSNEIVMLKEDIILLEKQSLFHLIHTCFNPYNNIDILSLEYNKYISMDINDKQYRFLMADFVEYDSAITTCVETLYLLNNNIFDILFKRYCNQASTYNVYTYNVYTYNVYILNYQRNIEFHINKMKLPKKYSSLLSIKTNFS
jgi:hypothetical protein